MQKIDSIFLYNFRLHNTLHIDFVSNGLNFIVGNNATGKTTILEALSMLCEHNGFLKTHSENLISYLHPVSHLIIKSNDMEYKIEINKKSKIYKINNKNKNFLNISNKFKILYFIPKMQFSFLSSQGRRDFFNQFVAQIFPENTKKNNMYGKLAKERLNILKHSNDDKWVSNIEMQMATLSLELINFRQNSYNLLLSLNSNFKFILTEDFDYNLSQEKISQIFKNNRQLDMKSNRTNKSCHRFNFQIFNNNDIEYEQMSNSQQKFALIYTKIAFAEVIFKRFSVRPILLLDEILGSFDENKIIEIIHELSKYFGQIIASVPYVDYNILPKDTKIIKLN